MRIRPDWDKYFLRIAKIVSERSHDIHTQHGCVIVKKNKIVGTGYNGFPHGCDDDDLPLERPDKYPWMIHSERNALLNLTQPAEGGIAYVTGPPCFDCLINLYQAGIDRIVYPASSHSTKLYDEEMQNRISLFINHIQIGIREIDDPDLFKFGI